MAWCNFDGRVKLSLTIKPESSAIRLRRFDIHSRAPTLTYSPPSSAAEITGLSREQAAAAFDPHDAPGEWLADNARLAILFPPGLVVSASPAMLALFDARDREALETRLARGEGPSARRLRHLAATLPIGEPRLEQMRLTVDQRRPAGVNLRFIRIAAPGGASWLLASAPALGVANGERPAAGNRKGPEAEAPRTCGRFGVPRAWRSAYAEFPLSMDARRRGPVRRLASSARRGGWGQRAPARRVGRGFCPPR